VKKHLTSIILSLILILILSLSAKAKTLKGIKEFNLSVSQQGSCNGTIYKSEVETSIKYLLSNSKIKLTSLYSGEIIGVEIISLGNADVCSTYLVFETYSYDFKGNYKNSAGYQVYDVPIQTFREATLLLTSTNLQKSRIIDWIEETTKQFVVNWSEAQN
tara:strand:- start:808 stop:1287 length:480 start_codon:yes stop_codon:yes gene_type:complete